MVKGESIVSSFMNTNYYKVFPMTLNSVSVVIQECPPRLSQSGTKHCVLWTFLGLLEKTCGCWVFFFCFFWFFFLFVFVFLFLH
jgi:hypothetical protein